MTDKKLISYIKVAIKEYFHGLFRFKKQLHSLKYGLCMYFEEVYSEKVKDYVIRELASFSKKQNDFYWYKKGKLLPRLWLLIRFYVYLKKKPKTIISKYFLISIKRGIKDYFISCFVTKNKKMSLHTNCGLCYYFAHIDFTGNEMRLIEYLYNINHKTLPNHNYHTGYFYDPGKIFPRLIMLVRVYIWIKIIQFKNIFRK